MMVSSADAGGSGVRVRDASVMPAVPCTNANIPTILIGEKEAGDEVDQLPPRG